MARKIRWGVISTALIGTAKVIPGIQQSKRGTVDAIASRDLSRAEATAKKLAIPKAYVLLVSGVDHVASAAGGLTCTRRGAVDAMPTRDDVVALMKRHDRMPKGAWARQWAG